MSKSSALIRYGKQYYRSKWDKLQILADEICHRIEKTSLGRISPVVRPTTLGPSKWSGIVPPCYQCHCRSFLISCTFSRPASEVTGGHKRVGWSLWELLSSKCILRSNSLLRYSFPSLILYQLLLQYLHDSQDALWAHTLATLRLGGGISTTSINKYILRYNTHAPK